MPGWALQVSLMHGIATIDKGLPVPTLIIEPGRSIIARAGVAVYRIGARKRTAGSITYLFIDGEKILQRCEDGRQMRLAEGKLLGFGPPKYGYEWNEGRTAYRLHPQEREVVEKIFAWAKQGCTINRIVSLLQAAGIVTRTGNPVWTRSMVRNILSDPCYIGEAIAYKTRSVHEPGKPARQVARTEEEKSE